MQFKTFIVSEYDEGGETEALNKFLRTHKILQVQQQLVYKNQCATVFIDLSFCVFVLNLLLTVCAKS
jgi:hypothetical protein